MLDTQKAETRFFEATPRFFGLEKPFFQVMLKFKNIDSLWDICGTFKISFDFEPICFFSK